MGLFVWKPQLMFSLLATTFVVVWTYDSFCLFVCLIFSYVRWEKAILTKETWLKVTIVLKVLLVYRMTTPFCQFCLFSFLFSFFRVILNLFYTFFSVFFPICLFVCFWLLVFLLHPVQLTMLFYMLRDRSSSLRAQPFTHMLGFWFSLGGWNWDFYFV